ncbi:MAG: hypothetical protein Alpg2KO_30590 [Alphaproteobacteria bacterium]
MWVLTRIGFSDGLAREAYRFGVVGVGTTVLYGAVLALIKELVPLAGLFVGWGLLPDPAGTLHTLVAGTVAFAAAVAFSFILNSLWAFEAELTGKRLTRFVMVTLCGMCINLGILWLAEVLIDHPRAYIIGWLAATLVQPIFNFVGHKLFTYRDA